MKKQRGRIGAKGLEVVHRIFLRQGSEVAYERWERKSWGTKHFLVMGYSTGRNSDLDYAIQLSAPICESDLFKIAYHYEKLLKLESHEYYVCEFQDWRWRLYRMLNRIDPSGRKLRCDLLRLCAARPKPKSRYAWSKTESA